jgi:hypothetical protein
MALIMTGLWYYSEVGTDIYETFWVFAGLSLLFDFIPSVGEKEPEAI